MRHLGGHPGRRTPARRCPLPFCKSGAGARVAVAFWFRRVAGGGSGHALERNATIKRNATHPWHGYQAARSHITTGVERRVVVPFCAFSRLLVAIIDGPAVAAARRMSLDVRPAC